MDVPKHEDIVKNPRGYSKQSIKKKYPLFYEFLENEYRHINTFIEKLYMYTHNLKTRPLCLCGKELRFMGYNIGYRKYCYKIYTYVND